MDWQRYRLPIMAVVALALIGVTWWVVTSETGDSPTVEGEEPPSLPEIDRDAVTEIEIQRPEDDAAIRVVREDDAWRLVAPVEASASQTTVDTALDKLADLEVAGRAASNATHHERLEVSEDTGIHVVARAGSETLIDMWVGAFQAGNTMVRLDGQDEVLMVRGSIKFAFNKALRDWRDRTITDETPEEVAEVVFQNDNGRFHFREGDDGWVQIVPEEPAEGEEEPPAPIEEFDGGRVRTMVSSLARLRAADFAEPDATPESLGFGPDAARVTLTLVESEDDEGEDAEGADEGEDAEGADEGEDAEAVVPPPPAGPTRTLTILIGDEAEESQRYVMLEGGDVIYVVSRFMADRLLPDAESFQEGAEPAQPPGGGRPPGGMPGMPGMPG
ncbi:MAG TPA: DUF4340 domain-containing protein, partial [Sandaracinaceae bacterium LLY-WYZ-13_1]|nr:DUF4340 domain-containing protein [Sandaracinaceae bacterium LLY-WYZ-13_1]